MAYKIKILMVFLLLSCIPVFAEINFEDLIKPKKSGTDLKPEAPENSGLQNGRLMEIIFYGGDRLSGSLQAISEQGVVAWKHPQAIDPIRFKQDQIKQIDLASEAKALNAGADALTMTNGDLIHGRIQSMDDKVLAVQTAFAGQMQLQRRMIKSISPDITGQLIYQGPGDLSQWSVNRGV